MGLVRLKIRELAAEKGWTLKEVADRSGVMYNIGGVAPIGFKYDTPRKSGFVGAGLTTQVATQRIYICKPALPQHRLT